MPSELAKKLWERRTRAVNETRKILEQAADDNRDLNPEEQDTYERANAEIDALDTRMKAVLDGEKRAKDTEESFSRLEGRPQERGHEERGGISNELRAFCRGDKDAPRSFNINPNGPVNYRSLLKSVSGSGTLVPTNMYDRLMAHLIENSGVMQAGPTVLNTSGGENIPVPKTTAHSGGTIVTEAGTIGTSEPTFGQVTLGAFKYGILMQVSRELIDDSGVDLEGYLAMQAGRALGNALGAHLVIGTATTQPRGVAVDCGTAATGPLGVTGKFGTQSVAGQGADLIIDTYHGVISPYRNSSACAWLMADLTAAEVRKIKDSTGQYVWQPAVTVGDPDTILGKPVYIDPNVPAMGTANKSILFGDWSQYFVRLAGGIRFERSDEFAFNTDLVTFRALLRGDGALVDLTGAIKAFRGGTA